MSQGGETADHPSQGFLELVQTAADTLKSKYKPQDQLLQVIPEDPTSNAVAYYVMEHDIKQVRYVPKHLSMN